MSTSNLKQTNQAKKELSRAKILNFLQANPDSTFSKIRNGTNLSKMTVSVHLKELERHGEVETKIVQRRIRYNCTPEGKKITQQFLSEALKGLDEQFALIEKLEAIPEMLVNASAFFLIQTFLTSLKISIQKPLTASLSAHFVALSSIRFFDFLFTKLSKTEDGKKIARRAVESLGKLTEDSGGFVFKFTKEDLSKLLRDNPSVAKEIVKVFR
jgi:DNA-binding MarR family transcriptional regulator